MRWTLDDVKLISANVWSKQRGQVIEGATERVVTTE